MLPLAQLKFFLPNQRC